jgi:putative secretion ATPase (PEP-CTERM system associated)
MYEGYYNFTAKPFRLTPDPKFLYKSKGHARALAYLQYGLHSGEGFVIVTGDVGTGKTTLMRTLMESIKRERIAAAQITTTQLDSQELLRLIVSSFNIRPQNLPQNVPKAQLLYDIEAFLLARAKEKKRVLLIVDEAQNLPVESLEELRMLSNIQYGDNAILQSFLLGQREFQDTLRSGSLEQFRQRVLTSYHLGALSQEETTEYIHHRLGMVGWKGDPTITEMAYQRIFEQTQGIPRKINTFCDRLFLYGSLEELHEFDENTVNHVINERLNEIGEESETGKDETDNQPQSLKPSAIINEPIRLRLAESPNNDIEGRLLALEKRIASLEANAGPDRDKIIKYLLRVLLSDANISELLESIPKEGLG